MLNDDQEITVSGEYWRRNALKIDWWIDWLIDLMWGRGKGWRREDLRQTPHCVCGAQHRLYPTTPRSQPELKPKVTHLSSCVPRHIRSAWNHFRSLLCMVQIHNTKSQVLTPINFSRFQLSIGYRLGNSPEHLCSTRWPSEQECFMLWLYHPRSKPQWVPWQQKNDWRIS